MSAEPKCKVCHDTGMLPFSDYLDCHYCGCATERAALNEWYAKLPPVDPDMYRWLVHQRAIGIGKAAAGAPTMPQQTPPRARKVGGSYQAEGMIVSSFKTLAGEQRYVFEFDSPKGMLHIFGPSQIEIEEKVADVPPAPAGYNERETFIWQQGVRAGQASSPEGWQLMPVEATVEMLGCIVRDIYPDDWNAGTLAQRTRSFDQIPPVHEYETAWGQYQRLLDIAPKP